MKKKEGISIDSLHWDESTVFCTSIVIVVEIENKFKRSMTQKKKNAHTMNKRIYHIYSTVCENIN